MSVLAAHNLVVAQESEQPILRKIERVLERCQLRDDPQSSCAAGLLPKLVSPDGDEIELPSFVFQLLKQIADESARGSAVGVVFVPRELSISEAMEWFTDSLIMKWCC
ncbi:MAG TPA: hypothetical protein VN207_02685 [Ktedonobacteraceae bacterium]|nr:hypothetical protein [Ktedonobacteraceae bacterium]